MPPKIRELIAEPGEAGFVDRGGKGAHRNSRHPRGRRVTVSGNLGDDAKPYQEEQVRRAIGATRPWSAEDDAFVGSCPGLVGPCCHDDDEVDVYRQPCEIVAEWVEIARRGGVPLPPPTASRVALLAEPA